MVLEIKDVIFALAELFTIFLIITNFEPFVSVFELLVPFPLTYLIGIAIYVVVLPIVALTVAFIFYAITASFIGEKYFKTYEKPKESCLTPKDFYVLTATIVAGFLGEKVYYLILGYSNIEYILAITFSLMFIIFFSSYKISEFYGNWFIFRQG